MPPTPKLNRVTTGVYTHPAGHIVERLILSTGAAWRLQYPNGDASTCDTLTEARGYIAADLAAV